MPAYIDDIKIDVPKGTKQDGKAVVVSGVMGAETWAKEILHEHDLWEKSGYANSAKPLNFLDIESINKAFDDRLDKINNIFKEQIHLIYSDGSVPSWHQCGIDCYRSEVIHCLHNDKKWHIFRLNLQRDKFFSIQNMVDEIKPEGSVDKKETNKSPSHNNQITKENKMSLNIQKYHDWKEFLKDNTMEEIVAAKIDFEIVNWFKFKVEEFKSNCSEYRSYLVDRKLIETIPYELQVLQEATVNLSRYEIKTLDALKMQEVKYINDAKAIRANGNADKVDYQIYENGIAIGVRGTVGHVGPTDFTAQEAAYERPLEDIENSTMFARPLMRDHDTLADSQPKDAAANGIMCRMLVVEDWRELKNIPIQTEQLCTIALMQDWRAINLIKSPSKESVALASILCYKEKL